MATATTVQQNQVGFAPEIAPYGQNLLGTAAGTVYQYQKDASGQNVLDDNGMPIISGIQPYQEYTGERQAQFTPLQKQSFEGAQQMQPSYQLQGATGLAGLAGQQALNTQYNPLNYQPRSITGGMGGGYGGMGGYGGVMQPHVMPPQGGYGGFNNIPGTGGGLPAMSRDQMDMAIAQKSQAPRGATPLGLDDSGMTSAYSGGNAPPPGFHYEDWGAAEQANAANQARNAAMRANPQAPTGPQTGVAGLLQGMGTINAQSTPPVGEDGRPIRSTGMPMEDVPQVMPTQGGYGASLPQAPQSTLDQYMSPYVQNVIQRQQQDATRQAAIAGQAQQAQAARAGAFGGSGDYLMRGQAAGNLARQKGDIAATGYQNAYTQALNQFNTEQQANQQAAQLNEQSRQYGAGLGLQGLQTALTGAGQLNTIGQTAFGQSKDINALQNQYGTQQQNQMNTILGNQYQEYLNKQNQPYKQLGFMSDIVRGAPLSQMGSTIYAPAPSAVSQLAGLGATAYGASMRPAKKGGHIKEKRYAKGGVVQDVTAKERPAGLVELALSKMR